MVEALERLTLLLGRVLTALDTLPSLVNPDGSAVARLPGRHLADWEELTAWYTGSGGDAY